MTRRRFSRDDWVALGLAELSANGAEAVKLEAICAAANLTRGSFYHHFADHESFLVALADAWHRTQTQDVASAIDPDAPAAQQDAALTEAAMAIDYRLELGIREVGRRRPAVAQIVRDADDLRLDVLTSLYCQRFALDDATARNCAHLEYAAFSGIILLDPDMDRDRQLELAALYDRMIRAALGGDAPA
ncbi:TetR/AcrR family transcriptional regulator [uncultured Tateyamaria sp.]|uniref:TetR/AcrR family transcriptional regulator n=1 Tax=Tateyamaria sp. 1078 TaxID=3417464 RepID=UPI00262C7F76|nr:TetR/AcrR family transcriptional regulator [uncultured Tateyamaria sp.]